MLRDVTRKRKESLSVALGNERFAQYLIRKQFGKQIEEASVKNVELRTLKKCVQEVSVQVRSEEVSESVL